MFVLLFSRRVASQSRETLRAVHVHVCQSCYMTQFSSDPGTCTQLYRLKWLSKPQPLVVLALKSNTGIYMYIKLKGAINNNELAQSTQ